MNRRARLVLLALLTLAVLLLWPHLIHDAPPDPVERDAPPAGGGAPRLEGRAARPAVEPQPPAPTPSPSAAPATPARTWTGRVVDAAGEPVPRAYVAAQHVETRIFVNVCCDDDGDWSIALPDPGPWELLAAAQGRGRASLPPRPADVGTVTLPDVVLRGEGVLAGRAVFPDDTPVDRLTLLAVSVPDAPASFQVPGLGLARGTAQTDQAGRFHLAGLRPGRYRITVHSPWLSLDPFETSTEEGLLRLEIPRHRTRVHVIDPGGLPIAGAGVGFGRREGDRWRAWGLEEAVDGTVDLWLAPEWTWAIGARAPGYAAVEREVAVPERPWDQQVRFEVPPGGRATGRLGVELVDEKGSPLLHDVLTLALPRSGLHVMQLEGASGAPGGTWYDAPPGTWRLVVYPAGTLAFTYADFQRPVVSEVDVRTGAPTTARLVSHPGPWRLRGFARAPELESEVVRVDVVPGRTADVELVVRPR